MRSPALLPVACAGAALAALVLPLMTPVGAAGAGSPQLRTAVAAAASSTPVPALPARSDGSPQPVRAVPTYVTSGQVQARTGSGSGSADVAFAAARPGGSTPLWGDWFGQGVETPAYFKNGQWVFQRSNLIPEKLGPSPITPITRYGTRGDRPVVGDWDDDGRDDIGVKRGNRWLLARGVNYERGGSVSSWRAFSFGGTRSLPVAGNWDGRAGDGVGAFEKGVFKVTNDLKSKPRVYHARIPAGRGYAYRSGDVPVAGAWTPGRDSVGVVRGSQWFQRRTLTRAPLTRISVPRPASSVPTPWTTPTGAQGEVCPTISTRFRPTLWDVSQAPAVDRSGFGQVSVPQGAGVRTALQRVERFMLNGNYTPKIGRQANRVYADLRGTYANQEFAIRPAAMSALTVAVATSTGVHDEAATGRTRAEAARFVDFTVRSLACQHQSVSPGGWGHRGQSEHWASMIGLAAWLSWDDLAPQTRTYVVAMMADEADYQTTLAYPYWRDAAGSFDEFHRGNTEAEETSWTVPLLELAVQMMGPDDRRAAAYRSLAVQRAVMAYSVPSELTSTEQVNGVALRDRLRGYNALDDGIVVNHSQVHPDYMGNIQHLWWAADVTRLAGTPMPEAYLHNGERFYSAFSTRDFKTTEKSPATGRNFLTPGGTIYRPQDRDTNDMYFPDGVDWGLPRRAPFMSLDAHALTYGLASAQAWPAADALTAHTRGQLALGDSSGASDGRTYNTDPRVADVQDKFEEGREEYAAQQVATAWLALVMGEGQQPGVDTSTYAVPSERNARSAPPRSRVLGP